jgi:tRNA A-37 threonylcarbamoyl transferase component Bud32
MIASGNIIQERYRIIRPLGSGGFGAVYLAEDQRLGRQVAIKEMSEARLDDEERRVANELFEREAMMLAQLDHPGLTRIWDYFRERSHAFLVMEYVPGLTLRDLLRQPGAAPLPEEFVIECAIQLCAVLAYLHSRVPPVIFRDLKPANVMVVQPPGVEPADLVNLSSESLVFKLIDFGIARIFKPEQTGDTLIIGTPGYAPPEQYGQGQTDARSDVYSLGATMHHLLSGQAPAGMPLPPISEAAPTVSPDIARVVARATMLNPAERYPDVDALRRELPTVARTRLADRPPTADHWEARHTKQPATPRITVPLAPTVAPARPRPASGMPLLVLIAGILVVVALGAVALGTLNPPAQESRRPSNAPAPTGARPTVAPQAEWALPGAPGRVAFGKLNNNGNYDLFVATLDGAPPRSIAAEGSNIAPAWSPDGKRIAITRAVNDGRTIFIGDINNPASQQVSPPEVFARYAAWSPDGSALALGVSPNLNGPFQLEIVDLASGLVRLTGPSGVAWIAWGRGALLYAAPAGPGAPQDIFALDVSGTPRNLTNTPDIEEDFPDRSPDGSRIVFVASPPGRENLPLRQIYVMNADGSGRKPLTQGDGPHTNPVWSPDGKWIAYLSQAAGADWQVWAMRADGREPRQLTFGPERKFYLAWGR